MLLFFVQPRMYQTNRGFGVIEYFIYSLIQPCHKKGHCHQLIGVIIGQGEPTDSFLKFLMPLLL